MSASLSEVISAGGFDLQDVDDARWLLGCEDEFNELLEEAEDLVDKYEEYESYVEELEDSGERDRIVPFEEWKNI